MGNILSQRRNTLSLEQENFTRCGKALIGTGTKILQDILESYIPSKDIFSKLTSTTHPDLWKKRLNPQQKALIGKAGTDGYTNFDITLCYTLLRNLNVNAYVPFKLPFPKPTRGWGNQPLATDTTQSDDIERIRILRNEMYGHLARPSIPNIQFADVWGQLKDLCTRMKGHYPKGTDFEKEFSALESFKFNRIQWDSIVQLVQKSREQEEAIADHKKSIAEHTKRLDSLEVKHSILDQNIQTMSKEQKRQGKKIEDHDKKIDELDKTIDEHEKMVDEHGKKIIEHSKIIKEEGKNIAQQGKKIEEHDKVIDEHSKKIDEHGKSIHSHGKMIDDYGQTIDEHGQTIDEHYEMIDDHDQKIDALDVQYQNQQAELLNINEKLKANRTETVPVSEEDVHRLKRRLISINDNITKVITLSALQEKGEELPIELLYVQVVICEDVKYSEQGHTTSKRLRKVMDPADLFLKDGEMVETIYLLGDAAHGKTTYCIWLLKKWCNAQKKSQNLDEWEIALKKFDFVFLLQFRYVNPKRAYVLDMICHDIFKNDKGCHAVIEHVLQNENFRSLIIMDGLDEWNPNKEARNRLTDEGIPNIEDMSSTVSSFISMRPWMFPKITKLEINKKVLEIQGLSETGMDEVIKNVLLNHYRLMEDSPKFTSKYFQITNHLNEKNLRSFMQIPLLAVICVQIWYEGKQVGNSMTSFYAVMLDMLIERAKQKHKLAVNPDTAQCELSDILSENECIEKYISVLLKLGNVAYEGLVSNERNLTFQKRKLEKRLGVHDLQFALDVGLISQNEARSLLTKNVSVHFFHKSMQEFLAAIYVSTQKEMRVLFCEQLSCFSDIMKLSNVIMFICGLCPSLGSLISQTVVHVIDSHTEIIEYRESSIINKTVVEIYKLQLGWYNELQFSRRDDQLIFHVSDIILSQRDSMEELCLARTLLKDPTVVIKSMCLAGVSIPDSELNIFISNNEKTQSLDCLFIKATELNTMSVVKVHAPALRKIYLKHVDVPAREHEMGMCPPLFVNMPYLRVICLENVSFKGRGLEILPDMVYLETLVLWKVYMAKKMWERFVSTLKILRQSYDIIMRHTNIHDKPLTETEYSPNFSLDRDDNYQWIRITRLWPPQEFTEDDTYEILYARVPPLLI